MLLKAIGFFYCLNLKVHFVKREMAGQETYLLYSLSRVQAVLTFLPFNELTQLVNG